MLEDLWYKKNYLCWMLVPFSLIYQGICTLRRIILTRYFQQQFSVPVVVVGNITVGGVGKTPLVIELANSLLKRGLHVGIVSRGYGARIRTFPYLVSLESHPAEVGDEPLLIAKRTDCPVVIDPHRSRGVQFLTNNQGCDIIISDDGLQHYAMGRAIEIVVVDGSRMVGNGWCLPAGPLRETSQRLKHSDFIVINGTKKDQVLACYGFKEHAMTLQPGFLVNLVTGKPYPIESIRTSVAAVAAIGNPSRFFVTLKELGLVVHEYPFPDHYLFQPKDLNLNESILIMTEKDAVKCQEFAREHWFYLPVEARLSEDFWQSFYSHPQLERLLHL